MQRRSLMMLLLPLLLILTACPQSPEKSARDAVAASKGAIQSAQVKYQVTCTNNPAQRPCVLINKTVSAQNATITALETYCGFNSTFTPPEERCQPVAGALPALQSATANLKQLTGEIEGVLK